MKKAIFFALLSGLAPQYMNAQGYVSLSPLASPQVTAAMPQAIPPSFIGISYSADYKKVIISGASYPGQTIKLYLSDGTPSTAVRLLATTVSGMDGKWSISLLSGVDIQLNQANYFVGTASSPTETESSYSSPYERKPINVAVLKPNAAEGIDAVLSSRFQTTNMGTHQDFAALATTNTGIDVIYRSLIMFNYNVLPAGARVTSAKLSLYYNPLTGNGVHRGSNASVLQRVTSAWAENTVTWAGQPSTTAVGQIPYAATTSSKEDRLNVDITALVQEQVANPSANFGFMLKLVDESVYKNMIFASSDCADAAKRPELVIEYELTKSDRSEAAQQAEHAIAEGTFAVSVYPKPAGNSITVAPQGAGAGEAELLIFDAQGKVKQSARIAGTASVDVSGLKPGMYYLQYSAKGESTVVPFTKK